MGDMERFRARVREDESCHHWTGRIDTYGYGTFDVRMGPRVRPYQAHRWIYEQAFGSIPPGMVINHVCHDEDGSCRGGIACPHRSCVLLTHLEAVTKGSNTRTGHLSRTQCRSGHSYVEGVSFKWTKNGARCCLVCARLNREARLLRGILPTHTVTRCKWGHLFNDENTYVSPNGYWNCRICQKDREKKYRAKLRE